MNRKPLILMAVVALVSRLLGGLIGSHVTWPDKVVAAEEFRLLDGDGYALMESGSQRKGDSTCYG